MEKEHTFHVGITKKYNIFFSRATRERNRGRASGGIYLFCSKDFQTQIIDINKYWIILKLTCSNNFNFYLGGLYFPPGGEHQHCFNELSRVLDQQLDIGNSKIIIMADCNARIGSQNQRDRESFFDCHISASRETLDESIFFRN